MENFLEENTEALERTEQPEETGSVLKAGKFKTGEQLEQAYNELEAEFTRRSQRLNQLAKENEQLQGQLENGEDPEGDNAQAPQDEFSLVVSSFLNSYPVAVDFAAEIAEIIQADPELQSEQGLIKAYAQVLSSSYKTPVQLLQDDNFVKEHILKNEKIRTAILQDYLAALSNGTLPAVISGQHSGQLPLSPKSTPATLEEAGELAKTLFK